MTPLTTPIFDFHLVISSLMTPTPTPTPSLVKTSLSDGAIVGAAISSIPRYDLVKIKPTESEAEQRVLSIMPKIYSGNFGRKSNGKVRFVSSDRNIRDHL